MIVTTMSNLEVCDALFADRPKLEIKEKMLAPKYAKQLKKEKKFPVYKWEEYIHQDSQNRYLLCFCFPTEKHLEKPLVSHLAFINVGRQRLVISFGCWWFRKTGSTQMIATRYIGFYSGHFFSRYRERYWRGESMSHNELLCRYFTRNTSNLPLELNEDIQKNYREYGDFAGYAFQVHDGTCFIRSWNEGDATTIGEKGNDFISVVLYCTFLNNRMMTASQNLAIRKEGKRYLKTITRELCEDILKESLFRRLCAQDPKYKK